MKKGLIILAIFGLSFVPLTAYGLPSSIGIVATGKIFANYTVTPYEVNTNGIAGGVQINSISTNPPKPGASLQLNAILHVITTNGTVDYFVQNVLEIEDTNSQSAQFENNIWQISGSEENLALCKNNYLLNCFNYKGSNVYAVSDKQFSYQLPFSTKLVMTEEVIPDHLVQVQFMHIENGNLQIFDDAIIPIPGVISASFLITANPSSQTYYVTGLVWGGCCNGGSAYFTSMDSSLNLLYQDKNTNAWKPFPDYSSYGYVSTAETAQNIYSIIEPNFPGQALVELGNNPTVNTPTIPQPRPQTIPKLTLATIPYTSTFVVSGTNLQVGYIIPSGKIVNMETDPKSQSLIISIEAYQSDQLIIDLPISLIKIGDQSLVLVDGKNGGYGSTQTQDGTTLYIDFPKGSKKIEIFGTYVAVPEFGSISGVIIIISIIGSLVLSRRFSKINYSFTSRQM